MKQKIKSSVKEMRLRKADNGYVLVTEYKNEDKPQKIHISTHIDDVFATIEREFV